MESNKFDVEQLLKDGQPVQFPISGWSMYPFLSDQDMVTVYPLEDSKLHVNDVVLYRRINGPLVLHRIIRMTDKEYYLCGDNQTEIEGPLSKEQFYGILKDYSHNQRIIIVSDLSYQIKSNLWRILRPARPIISKTIHQIKKKKHL